MCNMKKNKVRVNISVDKEMLEKAKTKLELFGGKLSSLFNAYLNDFIKSFDEKQPSNLKELNKKIKGIDSRLSKIEESMRKKSL